MEGGQCGRGRGGRGGGQNQTTLDFEIVFASNATKHDKQTAKNPLLGVACTNTPQHTHTRIPTPNKGKTDFSQAAIIAKCEMPAAGCWRCPSQNPTFNAHDFLSLTPRNPPPHSHGRPKNSLQHKQGFLVVVPVPAAFSSLAIFHEQIDLGLSAGALLLLLLLCSGSRCSCSCSTTCHARPCVLHVVVLVSSCCPDSHLSGPSQVQEPRLSFGRFLCGAVCGRWGE